MPRLYARWMDRWENRLAFRDTNRRARPFEWGLDWLEPAPGNGDPAAAFERFARAAVENSRDFFAHGSPPDFRLEGGLLRFTSCLASPYPVNNTVHADYFPAPGARAAVLVLPQWNSGAASHVGLCRLLNRFGLSALRMSLAYHDRRMPAELERADYHVSSNVGRTLSATRQSVLDARCSLDWLERQGYQRLAIAGSSLGSCIALLAVAHDTRPSAAVLNHVSMHFADVVWNGLSCRHIRQSLEGRLAHEDLRRYWAPISPASYLDLLAGRRLKSLLVWASLDSTFLPEYSRQVLEGFRARNLDHEVVHLPCGHYTSGKFPFNLWDGLAICRFLRRNL